MPKRKHKPSKPKSAHLIPPPNKKHKSTHQVSTPTPPKKPQHQPSPRPNPRPWPPHASILLIGEGDFSFAHSLYVRHRSSFHTLVATSYDARADVLQKYPQAEGHIRAIETPLSSVGATFDDDSDGDDDQPASIAENGTKEEERPAARVLYGVDARAPLTSKFLRHRQGSFDVVVFNFPHTGGLTRDVNRQVRANQSLLVDFFAGVKSLLRSERRGAQDGGWGKGGKVLITLFEREPYSLWNVRDLGRHSGYVVERSWGFVWGDWVGYRHSRTIGNLKAKGEEWGGLSEEEEGGKRRPGKWRGEERDARTYMFGLKRNDDVGARKRKKDEDSDSD